MKLHINVTQARINRGTHNVTTCPVALAIRGHKCVDYAAVHFNGYMLIDYYNGEEYRRTSIYLPDEIAERIAEYDADRIMTPFAFDLELPE